MISRSSLGRTHSILRRPSSNFVERAPLRYVVWVFIASALWAGCSKPQPLGGNAPLDTSAPPNVVLIVMDTLRADRIGAMRGGKAVMPFLSQTAKLGTRYTHAISPCSWTKPSMASIFTGMFPQRHNVIFSAFKEGNEVVPSDRLSDNLTTLPELLKAEGYDTWGIQTNANLTASHGFAQGFDLEDYVFRSDAPARELTGAALEVLPTLKAPFLLYTHYIDPHAPYNPDPEFNGALGPQPELPEYDRELLADDKRFMAYYSDQIQTALGLQDAPTIPDLSPAGKEAVWHRYDLECLAMDHAIKRLVETIHARDPNTIFVFLSDHGEEFWERGGMGHGTTLHQEQSHVPFFMVGPGILAATVEETVSTMDLMSTLASLLQIEFAPNDGRALNTSVEPHPIFSFSRGTWPSLGIDTHAIFSERFSLIREASPQTEALYYLPDDPGEQRDITSEQPERAERLNAALTSHLNSVESAGAAETTPIDAETQEALDALGYIE